jgi:beta-mannosidase
VKFLPEAWPIEAHRDEWIFHKLQIDEAMRAWGRPGARTLRDYIPGTQAYVARLHQLAIERMRRRKYEAGGILHFHAIDFWPSVTMAAVDYYRVPTRSYATVQRSFQPVLASVEYDRDAFTEGEPVAFPLWVTNDTWASIPGASVAWRVVGAEGAVLASGALAVSIEADASARIGTVDWTPAATGPVQLWTEVRGPDGSRLSENVYDFTIASR